MGFAPLSNGTTSLSTRSIGPGRWCTDRLSWDSSGPRVSRSWRVVDPFPFIDLIPGVRLPAVFPPLRTRAASSNRVPTSSFCTTSSVFSAACQGSHLATRHRSGWRRTRGLVASRCQSWGSMRFCASSGGAGPMSDTIAGIVHRRTRGLAVPRIECSYPPEDSPCSQPWRVTALLASSDFAAPPVRDLPEASVSRRLARVVPMGCCPSRPCSVSRSVPSTTGEGVRWPVLPGPCSPSRLPSCRNLRSDRTSIAPCATVAPRLQTAAFAFVPAL